MSSTTQARRVVMLSVLVMLAVNAYRGRLDTSDVSLQKRLWGTGMVAIMLGFLADVAPQVAGPFAALAALGLFTRSGDAAFANVLGKASPAGAGGGSAQATAGSPQRQGSTITKTGG